jgi:hypothetical protein
VDLSARFWVPFLRSIFDPFLANSQSRICLFYGTFWIWRCLLDPFSDDFLTVHLTMILVRFKQDFTLVDFWWIFGGSSVDLSANLHHTD